MKPSITPPGMRWCDRCHAFHPAPEVHRHLGLVAQVPLEETDVDQAVEPIVEALFTVLPTEYTLAVLTRTAVRMSQKVQSRRSTPQQVQAAATTAHEICDQLKAAGHTPAELLNVVSGLLIAARYHTSDALATETRAWREQVGQVADLAEAAAEKEGEEELPGFGGPFMGPTMHA